MNKTVVWVIPHYATNDNHIQLLFRCISSILCVYPLHKIVIVDGNSPKLDHYENAMFNTDRIDIALVKNRNYPSGAYKFAVETYVNVDYYVFLQDSCVLTGIPFDYAFETAVTPFLTNVSWEGCSDDENLDDYLPTCSIQKTIDSLKDTAWRNANASNFTMVVGEMGVFHKSVITQLQLGGYYHRVPTCKRNACEWERRMGIVLKSLNLESQLNTNESLYNRYINKTWAGRL